MITTVNINTLCRRTVGLNRMLTEHDMVQSRIFGPKMDEVTVEWRRIHNEERKDLYCSPNIIWVIKSRRRRQAGHVERMGIEEVHTRFSWEHLRERDHLEDPGVDGRIILK